MKVALCVNEDYKEISLNASGMEELIIEASYNDADIIIFPNHAFSEKFKGNLKEDVNQLDDVDEYLNDLKMFAQSYAIYLVFGYDYFNGEKIINDYKVFSFDGKELENDFYVEDKHFSLNNNKGDFIINLLDKNFVENKKNFYVNRLYKEEESGGAIYYYNEKIKEIVENVSQVIYIDFK